MLDDAFVHYSNRWDSLDVLRNPRPGLRSIANISEFIKHVLDFSMGVTVLVAYTSWNLQDSVLQQAGPVYPGRAERVADFALFSRYAYSPEPYGNVFMFYNSTIQSHQLSNVIMAQPSGIELMQSDRIYTLIIVIFCYFFVRELVICGKHVYKNWDRLEFANLKQFTDVVHCVVNAICFCNPCCKTREPNCCTRGGWGAVCYCSLFQRLMLFAIPFISFTGTLMVFYPSSWTPGEAIDSMNFFRALLLMQVPVCVIRLCTRFWCVESNIADVANADGTHDCRLDCGQATKFRCWWWSSLCWLGVVLLLLLWECWLDKQTFASHREPTDQPPETFFYVCGSIAVLAWSLDFRFNYAYFENQTLPLACRVFRGVQISLVLLYAGLIGNELLNYVNDYDEKITEGVCDECALTAW